MVIALRQRKGRSEGARSAVIHADEASPWDALQAGWHTQRINHTLAYSDRESCTNQAEPYFARLRRMVQGQHHFVSAQFRPT
jgi:hypothetical protein